MNAVELKGVVKRYGEVTVLHGISLAFEPGEFVVFVGPSGCGKSTLLRVIAGLEMFQSGSIEVGGRVVNDVPAGDRDIAMVFQNYALFPHMTVRDNISFGMRMKGLPKEQIASRVASASAVLQLGDMLDRKPGQLSGGQRQRVAMGRALVRQPKLFLFDEPLSNLDAKLRVEMRNEIRRLHEDFRVTMIYVTHDQVEAMTMADRIVVLNRGQVEQVGSPSEVYDRPATVFVAGFMGSPAMNLVTRDDLADYRPLDGTPADAITLGVRPEHVVIGGAAADGLDARVEHVELLGADVVLMLQAGKLRITARVGRDRAVSPGESLPVSFAPDQIHWFDRDGRRVGT